jgi:hypothetical protein
MKKMSAHSELHTAWVAFGRNPNEIPYALREGRHFMNPPNEILERFSGGRLEDPFKIKYQLPKGP